jgi:ABC-type phosphate/phosphonate transport system substrate-binding protein
MSLSNEEEDLLMRNLVLVLALVLVAVWGAAASGDVVIGILAPSGPEKVQEDWGALAAYLSERFGEKVSFAPVPPTEFRDFVDANPQGFLFHNPWVYVRAKLLKGAEALATVEIEGTGAKFGGVIFASKDSGISSLDDLRGKTVACYKFSSLGAWLFQKAEMVKKGLMPEKDCKLLVETPNQMEVVYMVRDKKVDAGTIRTGILERMEREGKINLQDYKILNEVHHEGFGELCSTPLYPDAPVASLKGTPPQLAKRMKEELLAIPAGHPALKQAHVKRFVEPLDYGPIEELCKLLGVEPFKRR